MLNDMNFKPYKIYVLAGALLLASTIAGLVYHSIYRESPQYWSSHLRKQLASETVPKYTAEWVKNNVLNNIESILTNPVGYPYADYTVEIPDSIKKTFDWRILGVDRPGRMGIIADSRLDNGTIVWSPRGVYIGFVPRSGLIIDLERSPAGTLDVAGVRIFVYPPKR
jgi:hypothetical protein